MDRSMRVRARFATLVPFALLVTACGGAGSTSATASRTAPSASTTAIHSTSPTVGTPDGTRPTSNGARFTNAADAICRRLKSEIHTASSHGFQQVISVAPQNQALEQRAVGELGKLTPPRALARQWVQFLAVRRSLARQLGTLAVAGRHYEARALEGLRAAKGHAHDLQQLQARLAAQAHAQGNALGRVISTKRRAHSLLRAVADHLGLNTCALVG